MGDPGATNSLLERLPTEILIDIIERHCSSAGKLTTITQICSRFRQIAFGMTSLWNNICLLSEGSNFQEYYYEYVRDYGFIVSVFSLIS
jgi:hypothetical protein